MPFQIDFGDSKQSPVVGIDLGTTNSLVAYMDLTAPEDHSRRRWRQAGAQRGLVHVNRARSSSATRRGDADHSARSGPSTR